MSIGSPEKLNFLTVLGKLNCMPAECIALDTREASETLCCHQIIKAWSASSSFLSRYLTVKLDFIGQKCSDKLM